MPTANVGAILVLLALAGCSEMSNDEIITETKKCRDAGLEAQTLVRLWNYTVVRVQCVPKESHE